MYGPGRELTATLVTEDTLAPWWLTRRLFAFLILWLTFKLESCLRSEFGYVLLRRQRLRGSGHGRMAVSTMPPYQSDYEYVCCCCRGVLRSVDAREKELANGIIRSSVLSQHCC